MTLGGRPKFWGNSYSYDAWGNLLQKTPTKGHCSGENLSVTVGVNNQLQGGYIYDDAGNMTHDATANLDYRYDPENRIMTAGGFTYTYDADGNRVEKANGTTGTLYWYMTPGIVAESDLTGNLKSEYIFFDGERVARKDLPGNAVSYSLSDHLKTASVITDSAGNIKSDSDYYPWGGEVQFTNNDSNHYRFSGKERDSESGLDYFGARYYSNSLGRWISADWSATPVPVPYADLTDPQSLNLYGYVGGNPESKTDADGHCWPLSVCADKLDAYIQVFRDDGLAANKLASSTNTVFLNTFANGVTADLAQGFTNVLRLRQSVGSLPPGASTRDKLIAGSEEGGRVATIILIVVGGEAKGQADANALGREVEAQGTRG